MSATAPPSPSPDAKITKDKVREQADVHMMSTTAGGTVLPGEDGISVDSDSDNGGARSDVSGYPTAVGKVVASSLSVASSAKCAKRRRDRLERFKERPRKKLGSEFEWDSEEEKEKSYALPKEQLERRAREHLAPAPPAPLPGMAPAWGAPGVAVNVSAAASSTKAAHVQAR